MANTHRAFLILDSRGRERERESKRMKEEGDQSKDGKIVGQKDLREKNLGGGGVQNRTALGRLCENADPAWTGKGNLKVGRRRSAILIDFEIE